MIDPISIKQAATLLGLSAYSVGCMVRGRRLPHYRIGRRVLFSRGELLAWIEARYVPVLPQDER